ncbi:MAG TPA: dephospho-CoA kinase [Chitinophagales bacterium]|nr:dephospho-CoA kinase [Chitinophagales bacterium]HMW12859.1 dephospho-CoA kinase [Chitinophagales bacterium]HMX60456.1 dephospho-CoA kinase [Chitinophagales bacterium]HMY24044.1 dephospho-CoA kinase [Chitinophagales bacterium]HMZ34119.1 dephospho-CoA kinase [Chitinophagales bacterium]
MLKIGITGGIGSGKTTVCKIFETLGVPVYYADTRAKELMLTDNSLIENIKSLFGNEAYTDNGELNRKFIASKAFQDKSILQKLNQIVHPAVFQDTIHWYALHNDKPYVLYEAAIMFETGSYTLFDKIIVVAATLEDRISRTMLRDDLSREEVLERISKQIPDEEKIARADFVIYNDYSQPLIQQVLTIHNNILAI